jgi:cobalt-zinc-cadmium efflux system membrane fusion protein
MYVTAEVSIPPSKALRVPAIGVFLLEDKHYAFVEESPGRFVRRQLRAEEATLGFMRVLGGIEVGEKVLADGALLLQQMLTQKASAPDRTARTGKSAE